MSETTSGPYNAQFVAVQEYSVGSWRDGPVGSDVPVTAVVLHLDFPTDVLGLAALNGMQTGEANVQLGLRIKSRRALEQLVRVLGEHADDVWPPEPAVNEQR